MGQIQSLDEFIGLLIRRRYLIAAILGVGMALSLAIGLSLGKTWESGAVIQVETPVVADGSRTAGGQSAQRLQAIEQRLTTRDNLIAMIERHGLFADAPGLSQDQKVALLRRSVTFQSVAAAGQQGFGAPVGVSALIISTRLGDGDQAARVANDFAQGVLDLGAARQSQRARETLQFFVGEERRVGAGIVTLEAEIAAFKNRNSAALPATRDSRRDELVALEAEMRRLDQSHVAALGERGAIEKKDQLRETDRRQIEDLSVRIEVLASQKRALEVQRDDLAALIARTPEVERDLAAYQRRLAQLHGQYDLITSRLAEAETDFRLEELQHSEHFSLLERAMVPEYPVGGSGRKIAALGVTASLALAIGLAFLLDLLNPVLRTPAQMERQLDLRPVISIPDLKPRRAGLAPALPRYAAYAGGAVLLLVAAAAALT